MPDWITHIGFGWLILEALRKRERRLYFLIGCVLPDVEKIYVVVGFINARYESSAQAFFEPTHTLIGALLLSVISTTIFNLSGERDFAKAVGWIFAGAVLHLALDSFILLEESDGIKLLWPLTSKGFGVSILPLGDWRPAAIIAPACIAVALLRRGNRNEDNDGRSKSDKPR
jgi:membrane-bound metal-dependent hydrolase YbcI (DUF457 family)